jgi:drug/metabolite transporter (DMT)-like permease
LPAVLLALLSAALFGAALVTTHSGLKHLDAAAGARVSIPTATLLFWLLAPGVDWTGWRAGAVWLFALVGLFFPAAVTLLTFEANRRLGPNVTGTIGSTAPLFAVLSAALFLGEPLGAGEFIATSLIVTGSVALSRSRGGGAGGRGNAALWMPWAGAVLRATAQVLSKVALALWPSPFAAAIIGYTVSSAVVWVAVGGRANGAPACNRQGAAWFAATGTLNGAAVLSLYLALANGPVYLVSPVVATYPLFTLALSAVALREERLNRTLVAGVLLTVAGVVVLLAGQWRSAG